MTEFEYNVIHQLQIHNKLLVIQTMNADTKSISTRDINELKAQIDKIISFPRLGPTPNIKTPDNE